MFNRLKKKIKNIGYNIVCEGISRWLENNRKSEKSSLQMIEEALTVFHNSFSPLPDKIVKFETAYDPIRGIYFWKENFIGLEYDNCSMELEAAKLWSAWVKLIKPKVIVETGTYVGYSTSIIAAAIEEIGNNGVIFTIDPWDIPHLWENTNLAKFIKFINVSSDEALPKIKDLSIDLLVCDSLHTYKNTMWEISNYEPFLKEGGYIFMHDTVLFDGVGAVVETMHKSKRFEIITADTARKCGITIARKIVSGEKLPMDEKKMEWQEKLHNNYLRKFLIKEAVK